MIGSSLSIQLPVPWNGEDFHFNHIGSINFLVGPNGSGKSTFAYTLSNQLNQQHGKTRFLSTDRLRGMEQSRPLENSIIGDVFSNGFAKNHFDYLKQAGNEGSGIDTILLLSERMDLRIQVEATLSQLFMRSVILDWDSGNLVARVRRIGDTNDYRMDRDECHGIKELLVLLTHLYNEEYDFLIIDEPELNLHPQYQSFFMHEVRKYSGDPTQDRGKKVVFLITHSPFIVDIRSEDDIKSVISFDLKYSIPKQPKSIDILSSFAVIGRLNAHHKQLFFSDNPVFVEGIHDAQMVTALMEARGTSVAAAGSCVIDAGGVEEVNYYMSLCKVLGKDAHFVYDLDSLFRGNLRSCINSEDTIRGFLLSAGLGSDFTRYCGELDRKLTLLVKMVSESDGSTELTDLRLYLGRLGRRSDWGKGEWAKARTAIMTAISRESKIVEGVSSAVVRDVRGRMSKIVEALREKNIHLLSGGTIERYLPSFQGNNYEISELAKRRAISAEISYLSKGISEPCLIARYGELFEIVRELPSVREVDDTPILRNHLSDYIHLLQKAVIDYPDWGKERIEQHLSGMLPWTAAVFSLRNYDARPGPKFCATVEIGAMLGRGRRATRVTEKTNAGMKEFEIRSAD